MNHHIQANMWDNVSNFVILTGAGFSVNFGGSLSADIRNDIFNDYAIKQNAEILKKFSQSDSGFEEIYTSLETQNAKQDFVRSLISVFAGMNQKYQKISDPGFALIGYKNVTMAFRDLLFEVLSHDNKNTRFLFTLNQDSLFEIVTQNHVNLFSSLRPQLMIGSQSASLSSDRFTETERLGLATEPHPFYKVPKGFDFKKLYDKLNYVKLHGSCDWVADDPAGPLLCIGGRKVETIRMTGFLLEQFELFKSVINRPGVKLLIIGYSFRDYHINYYISEAIKNHGIQLFIWDTEKNLNRLLIDKPNESTGDFNDSAYRMVIHGAYFAQGNKNKFFNQPLIDFLGSQASFSDQFKDWMN